MYAMYESYTYIQNQVRDAAQLLKEENRGLEVKLSVIDIDIDVIKNDYVCY